MQKKIWKILVVIIVILIIITFTPLVTPPGRFTPVVLGLPYTLWMGFLITCLIVFATFLASKVHPTHTEENPEKHD